VAGRIGDGAGSGLADLLRAIRQQIERAKVYPESARRDGARGTVEVRFRIAPDGSVERTEIVRSSGSRHLDEASERTIRQAAPYPPVAGWIRIPMSYSLQDPR
jgi:TonB family protein